MLVAPPAVAVILVVPLATAVANPVAFTVAVGSVLLAQVNVGCVVSALPLASDATAVNCCVAPNDVSVTGPAGVTSTVLVA